MVLESGASSQSRASLDTLIQSMQIFVAALGIFTLVFSRKETLTFPGTERVCSSQCACSHFSYRKRKQSPVQTDLLLSHGNIKWHYWHFPPAAACEKERLVVHRAFESIKQKLSGLRKTREFCWVFIPAELQQPRCQPESSKPTLDIIFHECTTLETAQRAHTHTLVHTAVHTHSTSTSCTHIMISNTPRHIY